jgi:hypothetical protein
VLFRKFLFSGRRFFVVVFLLSFSKKQFYSWEPFGVCEVFFELFNVVVVVVVVV